VYNQHLHDIYERQCRSEIHAPHCDRRMRASCLISGQAGDRIRLRQPMILDTWQRAKRRSSEGVELMPPAGFQNYSSAASASTVFVFICRHDDLYIYIYFLLPFCPFPCFFHRAYCRRGQISLRPFDDSFLRIDKINGPIDKMASGWMCHYRVSKVDITFIKHGRIVYDIGCFNLLERTRHPTLPSLG